MSAFISLLFGLMIGFAIGFSRGDKARSGSE